MNQYSVLLRNARLEEAKKPEADRAEEEDVYDEAGLSMVQIIIIYFIFTSFLDWYMTV